MTHIPVEDQIKSNNTLQIVSFYILLTFTFLLPIFFVPSSLVLFEFSKSLFIALSVILTTAIYLIAILKQGSVSYPRYWGYLIVPTVPIVYLLASVFSDMPTVSLIGYGFEISTFSFILILFLLMYLVSQLFITRERILYLYLAFFASFFVLIVFSFIRFIFGADFLLSGFFPELTSNTVGKWSDFGVMFGAGAVLALITLEQIKLTHVFRSILQGFLGISLFILAIINFSMIWYVLGAFALVYFVYALSYGKRDDSMTYSNEHVSEFDGDIQSEPKEHDDEELAGPANSDSYNRYISVNALIVLIVSILFILAGNQINGVISQFLNIANIDVRPSWSSTYEVIQNTLQEEPVFGSGPNKFLNQWLHFKPEGVNLTSYWNTNFNFGIGLIPTFAVTTGIIGFLSWIAFLGLFLYLGLRMMFAKMDHMLTRYIVTSSFLVALFFWIMNIVYVPSSVIFALSFIFTGVFAGSLYIENHISRINISFFKYPRASFVTVLSMVLLLILIVAFGYVITQKTVASIYLQQARQELAQGNFAESEQAMLQAIGFSSNDLYYRGLTQVYSARANQVATDRGGDQLTEAETQNLLNATRAGISSARKATELDPTNYQNWIILGQMYQQALTYGFTDAYEEAKSAYETAITHNPQSPSIHLLLARLELANNNVEEAKKHITSARELKQNYAEAIFLEAQIASSEGKTDQALEQAQIAARISPNEPGIQFQLGLLHYNDGNYEQAVSALEQAVSLVPTYANAKYFLGLSYSQLGRTDDAIAQFEDLTRLAPNNDQVDQILSSLKEDTAPVQTGESGVTEGESIDANEQLPIEEQSDQE